MSADASSRIGAVAIGRNEGARLVACLASLRSAFDRGGCGEGGRIVYVDSGSSDGSVAAAERAGAEVVRLDPARPFTAARARNAGLGQLWEGEPPDYVQLIDGDCTLDPGWIGTARTFLEATPDAAVACGRRRERAPEASVYNRLCDREWDTPVGCVRACGGDALVRCAALKAVGGFRDTLIAGEEPELCVRLRAAGWEIWRLDAEMTCHDARMTRFAQWWRRTRRAGHAYAEGAALYGAPPERHCVDRLRRALLWGGGVPALAVAVMLAAGWPGLLPLAAYPVQTARLALREGPGRRESWEWAAFTTLGKIAEAQGALGYWLRRHLHQPSRIIEYK